MKSKLVKKAVKVTFRTKDGKKIYLPATKCVRMKAEQTKDGISKEEHDNWSEFKHGIRPHGTAKESGRFTSKKVISSSSALKAEELWDILWVYYEKEYNKRLGLFTFWDMKEKIIKEIQKALDEAWIEGYGEACK